MADTQSNSDQASMQSQVADQAPTADQGDQGYSNEQPSQDSGDNAANTPSEPLVDIDGEKIPASQVREWKQGYMRSDDYTRKTQQLAEERKRATQQLSNPQYANDPQAQAALRVLRDLGVVTQDTLQETLTHYGSQQAKERALDGLLAANPNLKPFERALRALGPTIGDKSWEEAVVEYGFAPKTALQRAANQTRLVGRPASRTQPQEKDIMDMTPEEYDKWKQKNLKGNTYTRKTRT